ncbi:MAG: S-adenosylmethionine:tRNA ribosyltransferase-isomerase [Acidimicrobiales bacterium]
MTREGRTTTRVMAAMRATPAMDQSLVHSTFGELPRFLSEGDLVVVNTSGTLAAEIDGIGEAGAPYQVHLSTRLPAGFWTVELRRDGQPWFAASAGEVIGLAGGGRLALISAYAAHPLGVRLWVASLEVPVPLHSYLAVHGRPIKYGYVRGSWPLASYQNVYVTEPGSAEMPSAGRPFTPEVITRLVARGAAVSPILLHTGVASLDASEHTYAEQYRVSPATAARVNDTHRDGGRAIAVGTTVVRALETTVDERGVVHPGNGWTETVITPDRRILSVDGLLTGWHEPEASHLAMLEAVAGRELVERSYAEALDHGYLWHEFGDVHLVLA